MAEAYKVLGQSAPAATTATNVYTVPSNTQAVVSTIFVCNRGGIEGSYRIAIIPQGETLSNKHYIVYESNLLVNATDSLTNGITLNSGDKVSVYASSANFSFNVFGSEIS